jgi:hypothetical protein
VNCETRYELNWYKILRQIEIIKISFYAVEYIHILKKAPSVKKLKKNLYLDVEKPKVLTVPVPYQ